MVWASFLLNNEIFREKMCRLEKKPKDGRIKWIVFKTKEKKRLSFSKELEKQLFFYLNERIFRKTRKTIVLLPKEQFFGTNLKNLVFLKLKNDLFEQIFERFY